MKSSDIWGTLLRAYKITDHRKRVDGVDWSHSGHVMIGITYKFGFIWFIEARAALWYIKLTRRVVLDQTGDPTEDLIWLKLKT